MNSNEWVQDNSRELAKRIVEQWDKHDKFRTVAGEDNSEPSEVTVARALLRVDAEYGCEVRDPCGTIWQHAAKLESERKELLAMMEILASHVGHYATMPHSHSDAHRDAANATALVRNFR